MAEFPALPLFTDAYLADTRHLTTVQHGAYLLLLMEAWRRPNTSLPDNDDLLSKLAGIPASEWHMHKDTIMAFWHIDERTKTWSQRRLVDEKTYVKKNSKKQRLNAKARWNKEKDKSHGKPNGHAKHEPITSQTDAPTPTPTPTPTLEKNNQEVIPKKPKINRGTRMTEDWEPSEDMLVKLFQKGFTEDEMRRELEKFKNYWIARAGKDAVKMDWDRTFANRMLALREYANERRN